MEKNVGGYDRLARIVVGPVLLLAGLAAFAGLFTIAAGTLGTVLAGLGVLVGLVLTVTALTQKCPLNRLLGIDTYRGTTRGTEQTETERRETA